MNTTIPDLWPDDIQVDALTPVSILRAQEGPLSRKTKGLLQAKVSTTKIDTLQSHQLELIAPALRDYRVTLLAAKHRSDIVYPVVVSSEYFPGKGVLGIVVETLARDSVLGEPLGRDQRQATTQQEFIALVKEILQSGWVLGLIQSLIARSNEVANVEQNDERSTD